MKPDSTLSEVLPNDEFFLTFVDERTLARRLFTAIIVAFDDLQTTLIEFRKSPSVFISTRLDQLRRQLFQKDMLLGFAIAVVSLMLITTSIRALERRSIREGVAPSDLNLHEVQFFPLASLTESRDKGIGKNGSGRVGLNRDRGEGSRSKPQNAGGGGAGGNRDRLPAQVGKLPVPSSIPAPIPKSPPVHQPTLPVAGIDLDPALWRDVKLPQYGDPLSKSDALSNGPGVDGGMGTRHGTGVGDGDGDGFGPGKGGNTGGREDQRGCCGSGASCGGSLDGAENRVFRGGEVERRARLLAKPEPQYTEEARRNGATGTVVLRVVFGSDGQVTQIRAMSTLPFGLTERAIAAARQIKFIPASKGGRDVSVQMQLEYNFNLY